MSTDHGNDSHEILFEQYKLYVEMSNEISKRRHQTNSFYISLSSAIIALFSLIKLRLEQIVQNLFLYYPYLV